MAGHTLERDCPSAAAQQLWDAGRATCLSVPQLPPGADGSTHRASGPWMSRTLASAWHRLSALQASPPVPVPPLPSLPQKAKPTRGQASCSCQTPGPRGALTAQPARAHGRCRSLGCLPGCLSVHTSDFLILLMSSRTPNLLEDDLVLLN